MVLNVVVELATLCQLHDHKDIVGSVEHLIQLDNVLVVDKLQNFNLPLHLPAPTHTLAIIFLFFILRLLMILTATRTPVWS